MSRFGPLSRGTRLTAVVVCAVAVALTVAAVPVAAVPAAAVSVKAGPAAARPSRHFTPGSAGLGDPYFPLEGNGGYNVAHYDLALSYNPGRHHLRGVDTITATATQNLSRFDLDLSGMRVASVTVNGTAARWTRPRRELRITPRAGLPKGRVFTVAVRYSGVPKTIVGSPIVFGADYGWQYTNDGAFVGDEPDAARTWFPSNDHPSDKATFTFRITVPSDRQVIANGDLVSRTTHTGATTFVWDETSPMATYLATIDIGRWALHTGRTPGGIAELVAYDPTDAVATTQQNTFGLTAQVTDYWAKMFGPYPFTSTGAIVDNLPDVGFSLETQTRPLYGFVPDPTTLSHELSHEWFGDSVSVRTWRDIWLNEGFATFAENLWGEHTGTGPDTFTFFRQYYNYVPADSTFWKQSIADPKRDTMFSDAVYDRGGMTLAALRHRIGDTKFFALLRTWTAQHRYSNATTAQFVALAEKVSGQDLGPFFKIWLWDQQKPSSFTAG